MLETALSSHPHQMVLAANIMLPTKIMPSMLCLFSSTEEEHPFIIYIDQKIKISIA